ncbi:MAG: hypothetical protein ACYSSN_06315 [Planctomycetota bacterium]|jgi:hypothetical protein
MQTRVGRFTCQLALVGVIISFSIGTALVAQHRERAAVPRSVVGNECAVILEMLNLPDPLAGLYRQKSATWRITSDKIVSKLKLCGGVLSSYVSPVSSLANPESGVYNFNVLEILLSDSPGENIEDYGLVSQEEKETMTRIFAEQPSRSIEITEAASDGNIEEASDTVMADTAEAQVRTKVRTKMKSVETILRKAVLESYRINDQIVGLRITGLDKILAARELLLKSGDVIQVVNGQPLISKKGAYKIFKRARKLPIMEIELLRNGKSQKLLYYFN